jgi:uncharacterized protein YjbI with pentapeptide repeats
LVLQFLAEARLIDPDRPKVRLQGADLRETVLRRARLAPNAIATLDGSDLRDAEFGDVALGGSTFREADLRRADFRGAQLAGPPDKPTDFRMADLRDADFSNANAYGALFTGARVTGTRFNGAQLERTDFSATCAYHVDFSDSTLDDAVFYKRYFEWTGLAEVRLDGASTDGTVFPPGWGPHGMAISRHTIARVCPPSDG